MASKPEGQKALTNTAVRKERALVKLFKGSCQAPTQCTRGEGRSSAYHGNGRFSQKFSECFYRYVLGTYNQPRSSALVEWLDTVPANKISAFGGDYIFVDGVYGHQYLARQNVARALA
jgi:hypothetical protein